MNIPYDVTGLLTAKWKVTLRSSCLGCLSWPGRRGSFTHRTCVLPVTGNLIAEDDNILITWT